MYHMLRHSKSHTISKSYHWFKSYSGFPDFPYWCSCFKKCPLATWKVALFIEIPSFSVILSLGVIFGYIRVAERVKQGSGREGKGLLTLVYWHLTLDSWFLTLDFSPQTLGCFTSQCFHLYVKVVPIYRESGSNCPTKFGHSDNWNHFVGKIGPL